MNRLPVTQRQAARCAFTLLEVLLAIALSAMLLALLGYAINQFLKRVDTGRNVVEQAQLARGVLRMVSEDLRGMAVLYEQDTSSVASNAEFQALFDVDEVDQEPVEDEPADVEARPYLGVQGDALMLQVDTHRVRPVYGPAGGVAGAPLAMTLDGAGITTVRYLLTKEGLVRQELGRDRAIVVEQRALTQEWDAASRLVAAEVAELRFRYHNGEQLQEVWDLTEREGATPLAVEVMIGFRKIGSGGATEEPDPNAPLVYYRLTVPLPAQLEPPASSEESSDEEGDR